MLSVEGDVDVRDDDKDDGTEGAQVQAGVAQRRAGFQRRRKNVLALTIPTTNEVYVNY